MAVVYVMQPTSAVAPQQLTGLLDPPCCRSNAFEPIDLRRKHGR
jgi:hypothetical protein